MKTLLKIIIALLALVLAIVAIYVIYVLATYSRLSDNISLEIKNNRPDIIQSNRELTALTYNIGFGAYSRDYSFFMDTGVMEDGAKVQGKYGKAIDKGSVLTNIGGAIDTIKAISPDLIILQEADKKSTRAYKVNEVELIESALSSYSSIYASNFHSAWLHYPLNDPHGKTEAGLLTLSKYRVESSIRRSYPISNSLSKLFDLDRCFSLSRLPVDNSRELVLINSHMSAYDKGGVIRAQQLELLKSVMKEEREKGNYVIVGGDFNHILSSEVEALLPSRQLTPSWIARLEESDIADGFRVVLPTNSSSVATCRSSDIPYEKGVNYEAIIDGFFVSDNIDATAAIIDTGYSYSDHNPVELKFTLR